MKTQAIVVRSAFFAVACSALFGAYTYYFSDPLTSINTTNWTQNGTLTAGSGGLTSSNSNGGSLISKVAVPDGSSNYEVKTTLTLTQSGGTYVTYLRASTNALSGPAPAGTTYAIEVQNPTFSGSSCTAMMVTNKIISGSVTQMGSMAINCGNGMTIRAIYTAIQNLTALYVDNAFVGFLQDSSIASGQPGIGVRGAPSGNSIAQVQLGGIYTGSPTMPPVNEIGVSAFANKVEIQWPGASEPNGPGVAFYEFARNGVYLAGLSDIEYSDTTVSPSTSYSYSIIAYDFDINSNNDTVSVTTPPTGSIDPREIGVRSTGSYWGGGGEQIDMRSGNLNYTAPILKATGRGGWGVGFNLTYNSQNWRQDPGGTWQLGEDVGYGYGWKLLAGSLLPLSGNAGVISEYLFTDATGAQYHLNQNNSGVWSSIESIYVSYDSNAGKLHFNDGSYWVMGSVSAGTEWDAGTMYPTLMEDSNGNEIIINYGAGVGVTWTNSSSRISSIEDTRGYGSADYTFTYNTDAIPHLTGITNTIGTSEKYSFAYTENYSLNSPFSGNPHFSTVALLQSSTVTGIPLTTYFTYDTSSATTSCSAPGTGTSGPGQLTQVTTPYCGHLRWTYAPYTLSGSRTYYEVQNRYLSMSSGAAETTITLVRGNDTAYTVHSSATLQDTTANAEKYWSFQTTTTSPYLGLQLSYEELTLSTGTALSLLNFTWAQTPTSLNPYIGATVTKLNPSQSYEADKQTVQTLDQYGNLLTMQAYNFGAGAVGSLARTYTNTYLGGANYSSRYIFNRLLTSTVTDGTNTATLASNSYDTNPPPLMNTLACPGYQQLTGGTILCEHDNTNYPSTFNYRGNLDTSTTPTANSTNYYDIYGAGSIASTVVNGVTSTVAPSNNYVAAGKITTNSLSSTMNWSAFLGLTSATDPNGDSGSIGYDANARPGAVTSPYGAVTNYTYYDTALPPYKSATTNGHWVETEMDGFGRTIHTLTGYGSTIISTVDAQYAPCGCSPLGKLSQQSQPYAPGGSDAWTVYHYDASGRTTSVVLPDGSTTTYAYQGNTVTVTDPAGKWKTFTMDAFGNLVTVLEPDPTLGNVTTSYTYDVLNHLTGVSMPRGTATQTRTFNYNSGTTVTGFLQSATNPENGTVSYTYNYPSNTVASKTDAKNQQLTYQYDGYNRLISVTWANKPGGAQVLRNYYYDTNPLDTTGFSKNISGRLAAVKYPSQSGVQMNDMYSYTTAGLNGAGLPAAKRLQVNQTVEYLNNNNQRVNSPITVNMDGTYTYNNEGKITAETYPSTGLSTAPVAGASYTYSYDSMYRLGGMKTSSGTTVVNNVSYNAANQLLTMSYPSVNETRSYNILNQLTNITAGATENLTYNYPTGTNNGKISSLYSAVSGETVTYTYDSLSRLLTANGSGWGEQYGFDGFGNLLSKTVTAGSGPSLSQSVNPANNHIVGGSYDANGNTGTVTTNGLTYTPIYDVENRQTSIYYNGTTLASYFYDAQNRRIWNWGDMVDSLGNTTSYTVNVYSASGQKLGAYLFVPGSTTQGGNKVAMINVTLSSSDQYFGSRRLAVVDQLGSAGNGSASQGTYYPWGEVKGSTNPQNAWSFATYWQDSVSGLDYAQNRYYSNAYGRFMTPDPYTNSGRLSDPQSWNRYAYTTGDPVNWIDPHGNDEEQPSYCDIYPNDPQCTGIEYCPDGTEILVGGTCPTGAAPVVSSQRQPGQSAGNPAWGTALQRLHTAENTIQSATFSQQCLNDIHSIKNPDGSSLSAQQIREEAGSLTLSNGATVSTVVTLPLPNGQVFTGPVSQLFTPGNPNYQAGLDALTPNGTNNEYWSTGFANGANASFLAGSLMHEILHNLGFGDTQIQSSIPGLTVSPYTSNISDKLATDCFGWTGN